MGSAGWLGHQPITTLRRSFWLRMFHSAFDVRERFVTGRTPLPSGAGSVKPWMPCLNGRFPVHMEVHSIGERGGWSVAICPVAPFLTSHWTLGILPASMSGRITFQSAASHPTKRTLRIGELLVCLRGRDELLDHKNKVLLRVISRHAGLGETHLFCGFESRLTVWVGGLQRMGLDELSGWCNHAEHTDHVRRRARGGRTPVEYAEDFLRP